MADRAVLLRLLHGEMAADGAEIEIQCRCFLGIGINHQFDVYVGREHLVCDLKCDQDFPQGLFRIGLGEDFPVFLYGREIVRGSSSIG